MVFGVGVSVGVFARSDGGYDFYVQYRGGGLCAEVPSPANATRQLSSAAEVECKVSNDDAPTPFQSPLPELKSTMSETLLLRPIIPLRLRLFLNVISDVPRVSRLHTFAGGALLDTSRVKLDEYTGIINVDRWVPCYA